MRHTLMQGDLITQVWLPSGASTIPAPPRDDRYPRVTHHRRSGDRSKRMKPERFTPYDLRAEAHTRLLLVFEAITSYYDALVLVRSGLVTRDNYFEMLARSVVRPKYRRIPASSTAAMPSDTHGLRPNDVGMFPASMATAATVSA